MVVTKDNLDSIQYYAGKLPFWYCKTFLSSLMEDLDELNKTKNLKLYIDYYDKHTDYSPERTEPCPDFYGTFTLRVEDKPGETVGTHMTLQELDVILCALYDFIEITKS